MKWIRTILLAVLVLSCLQSCQKNYNSLFEFSAIHPSGYEIPDGSIRLISDNLELIDSIQWIGKDNKFKSGDIELDSLVSGDYSHTIYYRDHEIIGKVRLSSRDTVYSISEYFPAYPGSWWFYSNQDSILVSDEKVLVSLYGDYHAYFWARSDFKDEVYVSSIRGFGELFDRVKWPYDPVGIINTEIYSIKEDSGSHSGTYMGELFRRLDTDIRTSKGEYSFVFMVDEVDTTITVPAGDFQVSRKVWFFCWDFNDEPEIISAFYQQFFCEGIGLVKLEKCESEFCMRPEPIMELVSYHIGNDK